MSYNNIKTFSSANDIISNKIKHDKINLSKKNILCNIVESNEIDDNSTDELDILSEQIELEKLENELYLKSHKSQSQPKNYGNMWVDGDRKIILSYLKKYSNITNSNLYDELTIQKIAKKTQRSEYGVKEEIKKMIFNDYIEEIYSLSQLEEKYYMSKINLKVLIKSYLEKHGKKTLYPIEIENKILKSKIDNIKLKIELKELLKKV